MANELDVYEAVNTYKDKELVRIATILYQNHLLTRNNFYSLSGLTSTQKNIVMDALTCLSIGFKKINIFLENVIEEGTAVQLQQENIDDIYRVVYGKVDGNLDDVVSVIGHTLLRKILLTTPIEPGYQRIFKTISDWLCLSIVFNVTECFIEYHLISNAEPEHQKCELTLENVALNMVMVFSVFMIGCMINAYQLCTHVAQVSSKLITLVNLQFPVEITYNDENIFHKSLLYTAIERCFNAADQIEINRDNITSPISLDTIFPGNLLLLSSARFEDRIEQESLYFSNNNTQPVNIPTLRWRASERIGNIVPVMEPRAIELPEDPLIKVPLKFTMEISEPIVTHYINCYRLNLVKGKSQEELPIEEKNNLQHAEFITLESCHAQYRHYLNQVRRRKITCMSLQDLCMATQKVVRSMIGMS